MLNSWKAEQQAATVHLSAIHARENWDTGNPVEAQDWYHRAASQAQKAIEFLDSHDLDPTAERIMRGNNLGMIANAEQAIAKVLLDRHRQSGTESLSHASDQTAVDLLTAFLKTLEAGRAAAQANIEWRQHQHAVDQTTHNIKRLLTECGDRWGLFLTAFSGNLELESIMYGMDKDKLRHAELQKAERTPVGRLWVVGSFWLMLFGMVIASVFLLLKTGWWYALLAIVGIPVLFLVLSASILRSTGDISEAGFLETVKLALKFQLSGPSRLIRKFRESQIDAPDGDNGGE